VSFFLRRYYPDQVDGFDLSTRTLVRQHPDMQTLYHKTVDREVKGKGKREKGKGKKY
jgi:hypothetical protein